MLNFLVLATAALTATVTATEYPEPPQIFDYSAQTTTWDKIKSGNSRVGKIDIPFVGTDGSEDAFQMTRLDLVGDAHTRGYDFGFLMAKEIVDFIERGLNEYYIDAVMGLSFDTSKFPEPLQKIFEVIKVKGALAAPDAFNKAYAWVYAKEEQFFPQYIVDEMEGMGAGLCARLNSLKGEKCDVATMTTTIKNVNMFPELVRMACSAYGAWGKANSAVNNGTLVQLRALDFGEGPWVHDQIIATYREPGQRPFVTVTFPGLVGVITGIAQDGVGVSEKVWMIYPEDGGSNLQPGAYDGVPDVFALREILQHKVNRAEAEEYINSIKRTWGMWVGVGDFTSQTFDLIQYRQADATTLTDVTAPAETGQPYLEGVCYVDKHPQPSGEGPTGTFPTALTDFYGNITMENTRAIVQFHQTGDVHIATYDYGNKQMMVSVGKLNGDGKFGPEDDKNQGKAYNRPYLRLNLDDLWQGL